MTPVELYHRPPRARTEPCPACKQRQVCKQCLKEIRDVERKLWLVRANRGAQQADLF